MAANDATQKMPQKMPQMLLLLMPTDKVSVMVMLGVHVRCVLYVLFMGVLFPIVGSVLKTDKISYKYYQC